MLVSFHILPTNNRTFCYSFLLAFIVRELKVPLFSVLSQFFMAISIRWPWSARCSPALKNMDSRIGKKKNRSVTQRPFPLLLINRVAVVKDLPSLLADTDADGTFVFFCCFHRILVCLYSNHRLHSLLWPHSLYIAHRNAETVSAIPTKATQHIDAMS